MIETFLDNKDTSSCSGCAACSDVCMAGAIGFYYGRDGGRYPQIDTQKCISCGACRKVCPIGKKPDLIEPNYEKKAYALMVESPELRERSASGGAFEAIATALHSQYDDLMVAGAVWGDDLRVYHRIVPFDERESLKKSKYVQSNCEGIYKEVRRRLSEGGHVLFTGTPCQVAALRNFLKKEYDNLFLVDLVCHGVPGEDIFRKYIEELNKKRGSQVIKVDLRHKVKDLYGEIHSKNICIEFSNGKTIVESGKRNPYLHGFTAGLFYKDSCYDCKFANKDRYGDITVGDYWRIQELNPEYVDYSGVSCVLVNTSKGRQLFNKLEKCEQFETSVDALYKRNSQLLSPAKMNPKREYFISKYKTESFDKLVDSCVKKEKMYKLILSALLPGKFKRNAKRVLQKAKGK
ncbi:Coenzyme F420-reducing hydrogenase, beta subunit [Pseudobutyrivibrio sp. ACV-2]|uniref:Coenzyme F420 hydrogenase/dehydrogenase, beta subunit C-terminal domain n=1 Tax=Pseudobutyrivibrio sp. ACV-2 TaxID=1520801 RepID=UPI00089C9937|nr:Coenzyme F420 hydrogenase/dehydrogenase, beta subunit C-terminal domain [Pseudobutyrivibrio sp. ACV-2]SEA02188.1 Coenzyme F420-reducing hydrogenase, beta subunit [Pseudobutyrivibrio sp. ACV-2]